MSLEKTIGRLEERTETLQGAVADMSDQMATLIESDARREARSTEIKENVQAITKSISDVLKGVKSNSTRITDIEDLIPEGINATILNRNAIHHDKWNNTENFISMFKKPTVLFILLMFTALVYMIFQNFGDQILNVINIIGKVT